MIFFFNDTATTEIYTLSLHDALPICVDRIEIDRDRDELSIHFPEHAVFVMAPGRELRKIIDDRLGVRIDRKSTRLNSSHANISYAVFCLKKNKTSLPR